LHLQSRWWEGKKLSVKTRLKKMNRFLK
jgi:hypothetical protein